MFPRWTSRRFPNGEWTIHLWGKECKYRSDGNGPGKLTCPGREDDIECKEHGDKRGGEDKTQLCNFGMWAVRYHPSVYCQW